MTVRFRTESIRLGSRRFAAVRFPADITVVEWQVLLAELERLSVEGEKPVADPVLADRLARIEKLSNG